MNTQIIKVYYGSDALPYKDRERTVHFPITGSTFVGSSDTTKIRFYVDGYLADENALWISVSKRADGTQGSQFLTTGTDENGDKYREMTLSGWYTAKKGDLYISLKGYQGGSTGYWDDDTGMYIVQGVPVIRATGSIKLAINYAPVGEYPYYEDEMASFQDLVAQLGNKLNITSGIKVVSSTSSIIIANEEEGQLFYSKTDKKLYQLVSGNIVVFFQTYDKDTLDAKFSGKVDKLTTSGKYVYAHITAQQGEIQVGEDVINNAIPNRTNTGQLKVPTTPTDNAHATSKQYVDDNLSLKADKVTTYTKTETDNAIASAISSVYKYKGSVANYSDLPTTGNEIGDVYNVEDTGDNYAWTGTDWDKLSGTVDLSGYYTKTETNNLLDTKADKTTTYTKTETNNLLDTKADKATTYTKVQNDELLNEKANTSGEYPLLTVGKSLITEQIENINDEVGSTQTNPFLFQGTGTDDNTSSTPTAPVAKHLELRGNTVKWNQLCSVRTRTATTTNIEPNWDGVGNVIDLTFDTTHKVLVKLNVAKSSNCIARLRYPDIVELNSGTNSILINTPNSNNLLVQFVSSDGQEASITISDTQLFDLTNIYGEGKEPTTYLQFIRDYPLPYYAYNAGELISCSSSKLVTIGCNQFDEIYRQGAATIGDTNSKVVSTNQPIKVVSGQTYYFDLSNFSNFNAYHIKEYASLEDYQAGNYIRELISDSSSSFQLSDNAHYIMVQLHFSVDTTPSSSNIGKFMIRLYWNETHEYVPYIKHEYDLPGVELKSAGNAYDIIIPNGVHTQNIGMLNLSDYVMQYDNTAKAWEIIDAGLNMKLPVDNQTKANILSDKYLTGTPANNYAQEDKINYIYLAISGSLKINNGSSTTQPSGIVYYEMKTPIVNEVSAFAENIEVDDFGTMEFVPSDSTEEIIIPQGNRFFYPADYVLFIDDMYNRSKDGGETSSANNFVTQSELTTAISQIPTPSMEGYVEKLLTITSQRHLTSGEARKCIGGIQVVSDYFLNLGGGTLLKNPYITGISVTATTIDITAIGLNPSSQMIFHKARLTINASDDTVAVTESNINTKVLDNLASTDQGFNVINASDIVNSTLTQAQFDLITNGKPTRIVGTLFGKDNVIFFPTTLSAGSTWQYLGMYYYHNGSEWYISTYQLDSRNGLISLYNAQFGSYGNNIKINNKSIPPYPTTNTSPQVLTIGANGDALSWQNHMTEWYGTQTQYDNLGTYDSNTIYNILES